jgi:hypothetical protein
MCDTITPQFISHYLPGFVSMNLQEPFKESLCGRTISLFLKKHINNLSIPTALASLMGQAFLVYCSPEVMLLTIQDRMPSYYLYRVNMKLVSPDQLTHANHPLRTIVGAITTRIDIRIGQENDSSSMLSLRIVQHWMASDSPG